MMDKCIAIAKTAAQGNLNDKQIDSMIKELRSEKQRRSAQPSLDTLEADLIQNGRIVSEQATLAAKIERRNRFINIVVEQKIMELVRRAEEATGDGSMGLEALLGGANSPFIGSRDSVDAMTGALTNQYFGGMMADLRKKNLMVQFNSMKGEFELEVAEALGDLNMKRPGGVQVSADARGIAEVVFKYQRRAMERENRAGGYILLKEGRVVRQSHRPDRMVKAGLDEWKAEIRNKVDYEKMDIAPDRVEAFLDSAYHAIVSGVRLGGERTDLSRAFKGPGNLAKRDAASRVIEFKTVKDWYAYDQKFGNASLRESLIQDIMRSAKSTALMTKLGTNPDAMFERVQRNLEKRYRSDPKKLKQIRRTGKFINLKALLAEVTGDVNVINHTDGASEKGARIAHGFRSLQTMAKLGGVWISALSDIAFISTARIYQGRSVMDAWGDAFSAVFRGMTNEDMRITADMIGAGLEGQLGDFMSRANPGDDMPGRMSKTLGLFFKYNLLSPWTDSNKRGVMLMISNDFGRVADKAFDALPEDMRRILTIYNIDAKKWEIARMASEEASDGRKYIMPGSIDDVRGPMFNGLSDGQQQRLRDEVREAFFTLLTDETDTAVPTPGARERAILRRGYRPGTVNGEAVRFVAQFKSFGVVALTRVLGRSVYGYGSKTMTEQLARGVGANSALINTVVGTTVMGYFVLQAKQLIAGKDPRPNSGATFLASMMQGGGAGIYGDFLFGQANRYGGGTLQTLAGPGLGTIFETVDLLQKAKGAALGSGQDIRGDTIRLLKSNTPFANLFYTKAAFDYLIWYQMQEALNPGYLKRMESRVKRDNDQTYWMPPSSIVATGGGFR
jgi:hypothetical protein